MSTVLYGALTRPPRPDPLARRILQGLRKQHFAQRTRNTLSHGDVIDLDHRDFDDIHPSNAGDFALCQTIEQAFRKELGIQQFDHVMWGELEGLRNKDHRTINFTGGGYIFFPPSGELPSRIQQDLEFARLHHSQLNLIGIGVNVPGLASPDISLTPSNRELLKQLADTCSSISVRDRFSQNFLSMISGREVPMLGDPALHLAHLRGIQRTAPPAPRRSPLIGINFPLHGPMSSKILSRNLANYVTTLKSIQKNHNAHFVYMQHYAAESVIPLILKKCGIHLSTCPNNTQELLRTYAKLDLHVGGMLHSCILAMSVDTPCIGLAYDIKHMGLFEDFQMEAKCIPAMDASASTLIRSIEDSLECVKETSFEIAKHRLLRQCNFMNHVRSLKPE